MEQRRVAFVSIAIVVLIAIIAVAWYALRPSRQLQSASQSPIIGKAVLGGSAPEFQAATTAGPFDLSKTAKPVFLEVFATWCPHCQRETTVVDKLYRKYRAQVAFVGVSGSDRAMDGLSDASELDVFKWVQRFNVQYPVAYDPAMTVANLYLQGGFPTFAAIDRNKKIAYLDSGEISYDDLARAIESALH